MNRRNFLSTAAGGALALPSFAMQNAWRRNLLHLLVDQLSGLALLARNPAARMPHTQLLTKSGVLFTPVRSQNQIRKRATLCNVESGCGCGFGVGMSRRRAPISAAIHRNSGPDRCRPWSFGVAYLGETCGPVHVVGDSDQGYTENKLVAEVLCRFAPRVAMVQTTQARH